MRILLMLLTGCLLTIFGCSNAPVKAGNNVSAIEPQAAGNNVNEKELQAPGKNVTEKESQAPGKNVGEKESQVAGKYVSMMTPLIYIELKADGTFYHKFGKRSKYGKYEILDGNRVIFDSDPRSELLIDGNHLISKEGGRYTKQ